MPITIIKLTSQKGLTMKSYEHYQVAVEQTGLTIEQYLKEILQYSGRKIQKLTRQKGILLNGKAVFLQKKIKTTDSLRVLTLTDQHYGVQPEEGIVEILYEDNYMLVVNKAAFQLVHPAGQTTHGTLSNYLAYYFKQRGIISTIRPVHRLDRNTSGCIIFAKDSRSQGILEAQLKARTLKRTYLSVVQGVVDPPVGVINAPIGPHPAKPNRRKVREDGDTATTHYNTMRNLEDASLLELSLETGRTHQIRVHLAYIGHPILGDNMYGISSPWIKRQALHASAVRFQAIDNNEEITVAAPLPKDFVQLLDGYEAK